MAQRAFIGAADGAALTTASTAWYAPLGCGAAPGTVLVTTEANVEYVHRGADATLKLLYVRISGNSRTTTSTVIIRKNGAATLLAVSVGAGVSGTLSNLSDTVTLTAGDRYCVEVANGTGSGNLTLAGVTLAMETAGQSFFPMTAGGSQTLANASVTRYQMVSGALAAVQSTESIVQSKALVAGAISNLQVYTSANGSSNATTAKSRLNGADGTQTFSISAAATGRSEDTTHSDSIAVGDLFNPAFVTGAGTAALTHSLVGFTFTPTSPGRSVLQSRTATSLLAAASTRYAQLVGRCAFNSTESSVQVVAPFACRLSGLTAKTSANASTTTVTCQLRINGATGNNSTTIAGGATGFSTASGSVDLVQAGDLICVMASGADGNVTFQGFSILVEEVVAATATGLTTSSPEIGTPAIGQVHGLAANALTTSSPALPSPAVVQVHGLAATGLETGSPSLGTPELTASTASELTATDLTTSSPAFGSAVLAQIHALSATPIIVASPVIGSPAQQIISNLGADELVTASPSLGEPAFATVYRRRAVFILG